MTSLRFHQHLLDYLKQFHKTDECDIQEMAKGTLEIFGDFIYDLKVPDTWHLRDIERIDHHTLIFQWVSISEQAACPKCGKVSCDYTNTYATRRIQDLPMSGMTVYHLIKGSRYSCVNPECDLKTFTEQYAGFADKDARLSNRLKDYAIRQALESSCNSAAKILETIGIKINNDTINQEMKKKGAQVVAENLERTDVHALSVDDINLRKGNASTACSVFIDAETHRVLVIVQGATKKTTMEVIQHYPSAKILSRDRDTAYASAGTACGLEQVADGFHLVQNLHKAVKEALFQDLTHDLFVREGEGWIRIVDRADERPDPDAPEEDHEQGLIVIESATRTAEDIERRIHLAGLKTRQANKYRNTMAILELTEGGQRTADIARRLSLKKSDVVQYRKAAPETIRKVELKIDEYYNMKERGQWEVHQKTIAAKAKPSSESIVEPYKETVLRMWEEGGNHRQIHPVIVQEGFTGCANAIYQYLIKYAHENNIEYGHHSRVIPLEDRNSNHAMPRPPRISIERVSRDRIYEGLLYAAAKRKEDIELALRGKAKETAVVNATLAKKEASPSAEWVNPTCYADSIAKLILDTEPKKKNKKKN